MKLNTKDKIVSLGVKVKLEDCIRTLLVVPLKAK
jgi:hypothetical protein